MFKKLFKPKELKEFQKALNRGDYDQAISIGQSDNVPDALVNEAIKKKKLTGAIREYGKDNEATSYIDEAVENIISTNVLNKVNDKALKDRILFSYVAKSLESSDLNNAISHAKSISDEFLQNLAFRKIAYHANLTLGNIDKVNEIAKMSTDSEQVDILLFIAYSYFIQGDKGTANRLLKEMPPKEQRFYTEIMNQADEITNESIDKLINTTPETDFKKLQSIALASATRGEFDNLSKSLIRINLAEGHSGDRQRDVFFNYFAHVIGIAGHTDASLNLLNESNNIRVKVLNLGIFLITVPHEASNIKSIHQAISKDYPETKISFNYQQLSLLEMIFNNKHDEFNYILHNVFSSQLKEEMTNRLVGDFYQLIKD